MRTCTDGNPARALEEFAPRHDYFIGVDSDGCAFGTMEIKHKRCFIPTTIEYWRLQAISEYVRETAEFVNLYSKWRGINRFPGLTMVFDLLAGRQEVRGRNVPIPVAQPLRDWIAGEGKLGNPALREAVRRTGDPVLENTLRWSEAVNARIARVVRGIRPFRFVRECLARASEWADIVVVSATPGEALGREWREHDLARYTRCIAGQEMGTKAEHLALATQRRYPAHHVLMIGDAPGDLAAAKDNRALFYPILPGGEKRSWQRLFEEGLDRFFHGEYTGEYERARLEDFDMCLPDTPPWEI